MQKPKLLIIDDRRSIREALELILSDKNITIEKAKSGQDALEKIYQDRPDLIILDLIMPQMDGFQLVEYLKGSPQTKTISIIVFTACSNNKYVSNKTGLPLTNCIEKPDVNSLCKRIDEILAKIKNQ